MALELFRRHLDAQLAEPVQPGTTFAAATGGTRGARADFVILDEPMRLHAQAGTASPMFSRAAAPSPLDAIVAEALARETVERASRIFGIPPNILG